MTSQDTGWVGLPDGREMGELLFQPVGGADPVALVAYGVVRTHCTRVGCYWRRVGCTLGRWDLRAVRTTLGQWIPTLVEQAYSGRLGAGPESNHDHRDPAQTTARERCRRTREGGAGLYRTNPGLAPARPGVHSADISGPDVGAPSGDRWNSAGSSPACRAGTPLMSAPWTPATCQDPPGLFPSSRPRLLDHQPVPGFRPSECLRSHDTHMPQK